MRLLITRPLVDARPLAEYLQELGHQCVIEPLLDIRFLTTGKSDTERLLDGAQALLVTSANGVRAFSEVSSRRDIAICAVGDASARAAGDAGFTEIDSAKGDVSALAERAIRKLNPKDGALVHVAGSRVAGELAELLAKAGFEYRRAVLYEAIKADHLSPIACAEITEGDVDGVLLFSPRTAESFVSLVQLAGLSGSCNHMVAYCLSEAVAEKVRSIPWRQIRVAGHPDQRSLIEILQK